MSNTSFQWYGPCTAPVIALIHGLGLTRDVWLSQIGELSARYRVLTYDLYGHGKSGPSPTPPSLSVFAQQLAAVLENADVLESAVVGFSMGGMIARRFAQDYPNRVTALAILNSPHKRSPEAQARIDLRVQQASENGPEATIEDALERWFTPEFRKKSPDAMARFRTCILNNDPALYTGNYRVLAGNMDEIIAPSPPIACPSLIITGEDDFGNNPEMAHAIASEIPRSEVAILPGLRHMTMIEDPAAVNNVLLPFLSKHLSPQPLREVGKQT